nr:efflux RND transporter permease subunit [Pseudomonas sp. NBRC 111118]
MRVSSASMGQAIREQNLQVFSGQLGGFPTRSGVQLNATVLGKTRMTTPAEFEAILVNVKADGSQARVKDLGHVALASDNFAISSKYRGQYFAGLALRKGS